MFANTRLLKFVCLSYLNNLPLFLPLQLAGYSKLPPPSLKVLLLVDELEVDQLLPLLVPVQLLHLLLVDKHHKEDVVQLDEDLLLHLLALRLDEGLLVVVVTPLVQSERCNIINLHCLFITKNINRLLYKSFVSSPTFT